MAKTAQVSSSLYPSNLQYWLARAEFHSAPANANNELEADTDRSRRTSGLEPGGVERRWTLSFAFGIWTGGETAR